jgi:two-component system chemotaxis response regulator CheB
MDGVTFLKKLMRYKPTPVIIISSLGHTSCEAGIEALRAGAVEILAKPNGPASVGELGETLAERVRAAAASRPRTSVPPPAVVPRPPERTGRISPPDGRLIVIGASTGGPGALAEVLHTLPEDSPPVLIVQHMPAVFTRHLADRLHRECRLSVKEAEDGEIAQPGWALVAPGGRHMTVRRNGHVYRVSLSDGLPVNFSRPSVDVLFNTVATAAGKDAVGVVLTGMGADGARGLLAMRRSGARTIAQDEASCVVFGMPREAIRMGGAERVLPLDQIAAALMRPFGSTVRPEKLTSVGG